MKAIGWGLLLVFVLAAFGTAAAANKNQVRMFEYITDGKIDKLRKYVTRKGIDVGALDASGFTGLTLALVNGQPDAVAVLIEAGANPDQSDGNGDTPLVIASASGRLDFVELLVGLSADPNTRSEEDVAPLEAAAENGHLRVVEFLLQEGAGTGSRKNGITALLFTAQNGHLDVARALLAAGADRNARVVDDGTTPLAQATHYQHTDVVRLLLESGADPNLADNEGFTPLYVACQIGNLEITRLLAEGGASLDAASNPGSRPLEIALDRGHGDIVAFLVAQGQTLQPTAGNLYRAVAFGDQALVKALLADGADINPRVAIGTGMATSSLVGPRQITVYSAETPLVAAIRSGDLAMVELLLEAGADPHIYYPNGTARDIALQMGYLEIVSALNRAAGSRMRMQLRD